MLIGEHIIYIELHKTGSTYTLNLLNNLPSTKFTSIGKHNTLDSVIKENLGNLNNKVIMGNIRNPWDWYVSLWAYGCLKKGGLYKRLTQKPDLFSKKGIKMFIENPKYIFRNTNKWKKVYADHNNPILFRKWLSLLLDNSNMTNPNFGILTQRFLKLYTNNNLEEILNITSYQEVKDAASKNFVSVFLKNEQIEEDLLKNIEKLKLNKEELDKVISENNKRINSSNRNTYNSYYDNYSKDLIERKEKLIIDKFNYSF